MAPHILIIDDERETIQSTQLLLEKNGYEVSSIDDPTKALMILGKMSVGKLSPVDVIILDLDMPGITGGELFKQLRDWCLAREVPVVVYTAAHTRGKNELIREAYSRGLFAIVPKACPDYLLIRIKAALKSKSGFLGLQVSIEKRHLEEKYLFEKGCLDDPDYLRYMELCFLEQGEEILAAAYREKRMRLESEK